MRPKIQLALMGLAQLLAGVIISAALLFLPAGSLSFPNAWLFLGLLFLPMTALGTVLLVKSPALLQKRLAREEPEPGQRRLRAASALLLAAGLALAGLDHRFGWARLPGWAVSAGAAAMLAGYALFAWVVRENAWLSRAVELQAGQRVVDTGPYGLVRHPMYAAAALIYLAAPLALGSGCALVPFLLLVPPLAARIRGEERLLAAGLPGYAAYMRRVRWRLLPGIW